MEHGEFLRWLIGGALTTFIGAIALSWKFGKQFAKLETAAEDQGELVETLKGIGVAVSGIPRLEQRFLVHEEMLRKNVSDHRALRERVAVVETQISNGRRPSHTEDE